MINPFRPQNYIRVSDVMDMIAERENKLEEIYNWLDENTDNEEYQAFYLQRAGKLSNSILLLKSVLKAKLKP